MSALVFASGSVYKRRLIERLGIDVQSIEHRCDERAFDELPLKERSLAVAEAKARSVAADYPNRFILGADQVGALDGRQLVKPGSRANNIGQLQTMSGKVHYLYTAMAVMTPGGHCECHVATDKLEMRPLSLAAIETYVDFEKAYDCAGGYKIESRGISLMHRVSAAEPTSIEGLPLLALRDMLKSLGFSPLWP